MVGRPSVEVRGLRQDEIPAAVAVLARGMRDNPLQVAAYGEDPERRERVHAKLVTGLFRVFTAQQPLCAIENGTIIGVTGVAPIGTCRPSAVQGLRLTPGLMSVGPRTAVRVGKWVAAWAKRDPDEEHVHLGPLAVDRDHQGRGIGSQLMAEHCRRLDAAHEVGYLETDKPENVRFYKKFGFEVIDDATVIGVPNWFMRRQPWPNGR